MLLVVLGDVCVWDHNVLPRAQPRRGSARRNHRYRGSVRCDRRGAALYPARRRVAWSSRGSLVNREPASGRVVFDGPNAPRRFPMHSALHARRARRVHRLSALHRRDPGVVEIKRRAAAGDPGAHTRASRGAARTSDRQARDPRGRAPHPALRSEVLPGIQAARTDDRPDPSQSRLVGTLSGRMRT
jgi:hypothetical protein